MFDAILNGNIHFSNILRVELGFWSVVFPFYLTQFCWKRVNPLFNFMATPLAGKERISVGRV